MGAAGAQLKSWRTFLSGAAVLLAVFPILDEFVQRGLQGVTLGLVAISLGGASVLLAIALLLAIRTQEGDDS